jgi:ABC-2 type transport system ATP-binding protein
MADPRRWSPSSIEVRAVTCRSGHKTFLESVSLASRSAEIYCLLGGNGAGKTTLAKVLLGLVRPDAGEAYVGGHHSIRDALGVRRVTTFVTGEGTLLEAMTARQNLRFFVGLARGGRDWNDVRAVNAMRLMGVPEQAFDRRVKSLPRDLVVALWLAIAWLRESPVLLLDEPTIGLDSRAVARLQARLLRFRAQGRTILVATADVLFASQIADRLGILKAGQKVTEHTRAEVLTLSLTDLYAEYVGRPPQRLSLDHPEIPGSRRP